MAKKKHSSSFAKLPPTRDIRATLPDISEAKENPATTGEAPAAPAAHHHAWQAFWLVLGLCAAWVLAHTFMVDSVTVRLCDEVDRGIPQEKRMPVFLNEIANDGYVWNRHAEELGHNGMWRLRRTEFDNSPHGRSVHWNSAFAWYLRGLGELRQGVTGEPLRHAIFRMSIWANPILLLVALGIFAPLSARRFGPLCGVVLAIGMVAVPSFREGFLPAYPDHHGLISFALLGMLFGIVWAGAGWVKAANCPDFAPAASYDQARHGMTFSAICGACSIWFSALSTSMVLGTIGISALITAFFFRRRAPGDPVFHASLWKWWTKVGAGTALGLWLFEYFPNHMSMRLEVNHPFYALAWLGGGWMIAILGGWLAGDGNEDSGPRSFPWRACILPMLACAVLPAAILIGGPAVYIPRDPFMVGLWKNIAELLSITERIRLTGLPWQAAFGWYPLFVLASFVLIAMTGPGRGAKASLLFLTLPVVIMTGLQFYQSRWGLLVGPLYIALAAILVPQVWKLVPRHKAARAVAFILLMTSGVFFVRPTFLSTVGRVWLQYRSEKISIQPGQGLALLHRQMARAILDDANGEPVVLLSSPNSSCILSALGGFRTVGTLYWENVEGLKSAAAALNAQTEQEAFDLLKKHGITHVSMMTWENFIEPYFNILHQTPQEGVTVMNSFGKRALFDRTIPSWTRPLVFPPNVLTQGLNQQVLMLRVAPGQSEIEGRYHLARFVRFVEGKPDVAMEVLEQILKQAPASSLARVEYADLLASKGRFEQAVDELKLALKDADAPTRENYAGNFIKGLMSARQYKPLTSLLRNVAAYNDATPGTILQSAWLLATLPDEDARDGAFALGLVEGLEKIADGNPELVLAKAAAHAATGDFAAALAALDEPAFEQKANPEQQQIAASLRSSYQQGKVWSHEH